MRHVVERDLRLDRSGAMARFNSRVMPSAALLHAEARE
jgi:hypothetical protein